MTCRIANQHSAVLSTLVRRAGTARCPDYEKIKEATGFTNEEYIAFTKKAIDLKKTNTKIASVLAAIKFIC
jgi:hypothetical protein